MVQTPSTMLTLGTSAPAFDLPEPGSSQSVYLSDFADKPGLLVAFFCNHCPFVKHIQKEFTTFAREYEERGLAVVVISSNDVENYPEDAPDKMIEEKNRAGYTFPYLYDADQEVAKAYYASCTPDFFLFDENRKLVYRGQFDDARPKNNEPVTGKDLRAAADALLSGQPVSQNQKPSIGCNIKWKEGNEPDYFG